MAGASVSAKGRLANCSATAGQVLTKPGTATDNGPIRGTLGPGTNSVCKPRGAPPLPLNATTPSDGVLISQNASPPRPHHGISTTHCTAEAASPASTALPPCCNTCSAAAAASECPADTMPCDPTTPPRRVSGDNGDGLDLDEHLRVLQARDDNRRAGGKRVMEVAGIRLAHGRGVGALLQI